MPRPARPPTWSLILALLAAADWSQRARHPAPGAGTAPDPTVPVDDPVTAAFRAHQSDVPLDGHGGVIHPLPDDVEGERHQHFLLRTPGGTTILIAHNIGIAPRLVFRGGDTVAFR